MAGKYESKSNTIVQVAMCNELFLPTLLSHIFYFTYCAPELRTVASDINVFSALGRSPPRPEMILHASAVPPVPW